MCVNHISDCAMCILLEKRVLDPLELELQMVVNHHVGAGNVTWVLSKSSKFS